jgi:hypothetical protein
MARSAVQKTEDAARALDAFLRERPPPVAEAPLDEAVPPEDRAVAASTTETRLPRPSQAAGRQHILCLPHSDWLHHRFAVTGPSADVAAFQSAAAGAGTVPWTLDMAILEEDWFHQLVDPAHRSLSLQGARILAAQLRDAVSRRHSLAVGRVGHSRACLFDLHRLAPVPADILALGPDHPNALFWLWENWGTTYPLRHVSIDATPDSWQGRPPVPEAETRWRLQFWSADWTPWRALQTIRTAWPSLHFELQPSYE